MVSKIWNGSDGNWFAAASWNSAGVPGAGDDVVINAGDAAATAAITALSIAVAGGGFELRSAGPGSAVGNGVANNGFIIIDQNNFEGGSQLSVGGTLANSGTLVIGNQNLAGSDGVSAAGLSNAGGIIHIHGNTMGTTSQATLNIAAAAGFGTAGHLTGEISLEGDALLQFSSGQITSIDAAGVLSVSGSRARIADAGSPSSNSALIGLASNAGFATLDNIAPLTTSSGLANSGQFNLDIFGLSGGSILGIGGAIANTGILRIGDPNLSSSDSISASGLSNAGGTILIQGNATAGTTNQATLNIAAAAGFGAAGHLTGTVNLTGDALLEFSGGQITAIDAAGFLSLAGAQARIADAGSLSSNSALVGLASNAGTVVLGSIAPLTTSGGLANSHNFSLDRDGTDGGSQLSVGGALANTGFLGIGSQFLTSSDSVSANGLSNAGGNISIMGNTAAGTTSQATLNIAAAAGFGTAGHLAGRVSLSGDSLLQFSSGQITAIDVAGFLSLDGAQARIADAGALSSNSALTGLASNAGFAELRNGASVAISGDLASSNQLYIDRSNIADGGSQLSVGGALANTGTLGIGNDGLSSSDSVTATGLNNTGAIGVTGNGANLAQLIVTGAAVEAGSLAVGSGGRASFGGELLLTGTGGISVAAGGAISTSATSTVVKTGAGTNSVIQEIGQSFQVQNRLVVLSGTLEFNGNVGAGVAELSGAGLFAGGSFTNVNNDLVISAAAAAGDGSVTTNYWHTDLSLAYTDKLRADGSHVITGNAGDLVLAGGSGNDLIIGGPGSDRLYGLGGDDTLIGGAISGAPNQLWGGLGSNTASYAGTGGKVYATVEGHGGYVDSGAGYVLTDTYDSIQNLTGGAGADILIGDAGNNILEGGAGADQLYGRAGANTFVYRGFADSNLIAGYDTIGDFKTGTDHIDLTAMHTDAAHVRIRTSGGSSSLYVLAGARFNSATDLAVSLVGASAVAVGDLLF